MTHDETRDLLALYALDALEGPDRVQVEHHLDECAECRHDLTPFLEAAAGLVPDATAPSGLWDRIQAAIDDAEPAPSNVVPLRRGPDVTRWRLLAGAAALVAIVFGGIVAAQRAQISELTGELAIATAAQRAAEAPGSFVGDFLVDDEAVARVVLTEDGEGYVLALDPLPDLDPARAYQLWVINDGGDVISAGVLGASPTASTFTWTGPVSGFALTREVAGGVVSSAGDVVSVITDL